MKTKRAAVGLFAMIAVIAACGGKVLTSQSQAKDQAIVVGTSCDNDNECASESGDQNLRCYSHSYGEPLPNGYCSEQCATADDCFGPPSAIACGKHAPNAADSFPPYCFTICDPNAQSTCRSGYQCLPFLTPEGNQAYGCWTISG
jgi:hypothetical protein